MRVANKIMQGGEEIILGPKALDLVDYVIEQGNGYTKWYSGKLEIWGRHTINGSSLVWSSGIASSFKYSNLYSFAFPVVFTAEPFVTITDTSGSAYSNSPYYIGESSTNQLRVRVIAQYNISNNLKFNFYAIGRWK